MTVSKLTPAIVAEAARLTQSLFPGEHWSEQDLAGSISNENRTFLVALVDDRVVGCGGVQNVGGQGDILTIGVDPACRRKGIGEALLIAMMEEFRQMDGKQLFLEVRISNAAARRLYEKCGFAEISSRKNYYKAPQEDAIIYMYEVQE
ncbi:MAG: ribosomal protein S18-alanine N-acetyltransferase [Clostridia bacterium]|nr:ribosomal protein S18-alanine N-acetyltransferase [Clostridia bacterium]